PGHVRSACRARETGLHTTSRTAAVTSLEVLCLDTGEQIPRPLIKVDVVGLHGLTYVDSGARCSIDKNKLYQHLKTMG
ncbi:hypothetical protein ILUMI_15532, partial [Ignelater luminosus]